MPGRNDIWRYPGAPADDAPRAEHEAYAKRPNDVYSPPGGFFWLACPRCGKMFGGHEVSYKPIDVGGRWLVCCCPDPLTGE